MHSSEYGPLTFHYNGDYSGIIKVTDGHDETTRTTFKHLFESVTGGNVLWEQTELNGIKQFVGDAAISEEISRLEQLSGEEALLDPKLLELARGIG